MEGKQKEKFTRNGDDVLIDFSDNKIERLHRRTVLIVEHYNLKSDHGTALFAHRRACPGGGMILHYTRKPSTRSPAELSRRSP